MARQSPLAPLIKHMVYDSKTDTDVAEALATAEAVIDGRMELPENSIELVHRIMARVKMPKTASDRRALAENIKLLRRVMLA